MEALPMKLVQAISLVVSAFVIGRVSTLAAQDEPLQIDDARIVTMSDVAGLLTNQDETFVAERSGRFFVWSDGVPTRWGALDGPIVGVAASGDDIIVYSRSAFTVLDAGTLDTVETGTYDGLALCNGGDAAWFWDEDSTTIQLASRSGVSEFAVETVPYSRANCAATPHEFALVWDDGIDAALLDSRGHFQTAEWVSNGLPVASWDGEWHITLPSPWSATSTCDDVTLASGGCTALSHDSLRQFLGPALPQLEDARLVRNGLVVQDRSGWTVVVPQSPPTLIRFSGRTIGLTDGPEPAAIVCTGLAPHRLIARDALTGAELDSVGVSRCPDSLRRVSGRVLVDAGNEVVVWNDVSREFLAQIVDAPSAYSVVTEWSNACAAEAWSVRSPHGRWFGPSCTPLSLVDVRERGAQAGVGICSETGLIDAFRLDGASLPTGELVGSCEDSFTVREEESDASSEQDPLRIEENRLFVDVGDSSIILEFAGRYLLVHDQTRIWASDALWSRVIWTAEGRHRSLRDRGSSEVWDLSIIRDASRDWN